MATHIHHHHHYHGKQKPPHQGKKVLEGPSKFRSPIALGIVAVLAVIGIYFVYNSLATQPAPNPPQFGCTSNLPWARFSWNGDGTSSGYRIDVTRGVFGGPTSGVWSKTINFGAATAYWDYFPQGYSGSNTPSVDAGAGYQYKVYSLARAEYSYATTFTGQNTCPTVPSINVSNVTGSGFTLSGSGTNDGFYEIWINNQSKHTASASTYSYNATGLACGTNYNVQVMARDYSGSSNYANAYKTVATSGCPPPPPPPDSDGDGIPNSSDACPNTAYSGGNGCPPVNPPNPPVNPPGQGGGGSKPNPISIPRPAPSPQQQAAAVSVSAQTTETLNNEADQALDQITSANVKKDETSTITSDDGMMSATFEAGTFEVDAECVIATADAVEGLAYGPYKIVCQDKDGKELTEFIKPVTIKFTLPEGEKAGKHDFITIDGDTKTVLESTKDEGERSISSQLEKPMIFGVIKHKDSNVLGWYAGLGLLLLLIIGGVIWFIRRNQSDSSYDDYIRSQYVNSGASSGSIDPGQRAGISVHKPGTVASAAGETHETAEYSALQQAQDRLSQIDDPTPPSPGSSVGPNPTNN